MADMKQDREALFKTIYKIATDLVHAGYVSEWDFKSYALGTMFYRYISENITKYINYGEHEAGDTVSIPQKSPTKRRRRFVTI